MVEHNSGHKSTRGKIAEQSKFHETISLVWKIKFTAQKLELISVQIVAANYDLLFTMVHFALLLFNFLGLFRGGEGWLHKQRGTLTVGTRIAFPSRLSSPPEDLRKWISNRVVNIINLHNCLSLDGQINLCHCEVLFFLHCCCFSFVQQVQRLCSTSSSLCL